MKKIYTAFLCLYLLVILGCTTPTGNDTKTIIGTWTRSGGSTRTYTELFDLKQDYSYTIQATWDDTGTQIAADHGTYSFTDTVLTLTDYEGNVSNEQYVLEEQGDALLIEGNREKIWNRVK